MLPTANSSVQIQHSSTSPSIVGRAWLPSVAWIAAIVGVAWLVRTPTGDLRELLRHWQFWSLEATAFVLLGLSSLTLPTFIASLRLERRDLFLPIAASLLACVLAGLVAPRTNRIYYDEQIYQGIGQNLSDLRLAQMCNDGTVEYGVLQCWRGEYNKEPYGYPYLLSLVYRVAGVHEETAFKVNVVIVALLVWVVFLLTTALTERPEAGGAAAVIAALIPEQLRWSHSAAAEPSAALACAFAVLAAAAFVRLRSTPALLWAVVAGVFAVQFRPEAALVAPVIVLVIAAFAPAEFRQPRFWWAGAFALFLLTVHFGHLAAVRNEGWGTSGPKFSLDYLHGNLPSNGWFYLGDDRFPVFYSILAGAAWLNRGMRRAVLIAAAYFLLFWGIFLVFYAGSYNYGADDRFSLMTYPPLAVLAGIGAFGLADWLEGTGWLPVAAKHAGLAIIGLQFLWYLPFVRSTGEEAWGARADVEFAKVAARDLPRNSFVLTHNPGMFHLWGVSAGQASIASSEAGYAANVLAPRYAGGVFFHWNFWCNVADPLQQSFCTDILQRFPHTLVREHRERNYRYALYRLDLAAPLPPGPR
jgi:hypothetical protein